MSNGTTRELPVTWGAVDPELYCARAGGSLVATGAAEGWEAPIEVEVVVEPAAALEAEPPAGVTTEEAVAPVLPATAKVAWSNGETTEEQVAWDPVDESSYAAAGTFEAGGTAAGVPVSCAVTVVEPTVASVAQPGPVTTPSGTAPALPGTVSAEMSNGTARELPVTWEAVDPELYCARAGGSPPAAPRPRCPGP